MADNNIEVIFENKWQALKVRVVFWLMIVVALGALWGGWAILLHFGLSEADGGVLRPLWQRLLFGGSIAALGGAAAYGMWIYIHPYVLNISVRGSEIAITTMTPLGRRYKIFEAGHLGEGAYHEGKIYDLDEMNRRHAVPRVDAPWITLKTRDQFWPFIIDAQAETLDFKRIRQLAEGKLA